jgi:hypothetical protein
MLATIIGGVSVPLVIIAVWSAFANWGKPPRPPSTRARTRLAEYRARDTRRKAMREAARVREEHEAAQGREEREEADRHIPGILSVTCPVCLAFPGHSCGFIPDIEIKELSGERGQYAHPVRIQKAAALKRVPERI